MTRSMIQQSVKDYAAWKKVYDSLADVRSSKGAISDQVFQDANDRNKVTVLVGWKSLESAKAWAESSELKAAQERAGVVGKPSVSFLMDA